MLSVQEFNLMGHAESVVCLRIYLNAMTAIIDSADELFHAF